MANILNADLLEATRLINAGRLTEATATLQRVLGGGQPAPSVMPANATAAARRAPPTLDGVAEAPALNLCASRLPSSPAGVVPTLPAALRGFLGQVGQARSQLPGGRQGSLSPAARQLPVPDGAQFLAATFSNEGGTRPYKLYVPSRYRPARPVPLVVMLHGCTQSPDDFAAGTRMNAVAEEHTCLVVYPGQIASANMQRCWNWFREDDQHRDQGEPALIAGITREVGRNYAIDPRRVYVAGLSAGGAAAAIMGDAYPDLYAAVGVHSGLACGAASDMPSAFAAMHNGAHSVRPMLRDPVRNGRLFRSSCSTETVTSRSTRATPKRSSLSRPGPRRSRGTRRKAKFPAATPSPARYSPSRRGER
jgi:poly(hydroxyalkanoate) depolymerase family esterase